MDLEFISRIGAFLFKVWTELALQFYTCEQLCKHTQQFCSNFCVVWQLIKSIPQGMCKLIGLFNIQEHNLHFWTLPAKTTMTNQILFVQLFSAILNTAICIKVHFTYIFKFQMELKSAT